MTLKDKCEKMTLKDKCEKMMRDYSVTELCDKISRKAGRPVSKRTFYAWKTGANAAIRVIAVREAFEAVYSELVK